MNKLVMFNHVTLDGYFVDVKGDMSWAHRNDPEWNEYGAGNFGDGEGQLLFGRVTYQLMKSFWPTPQATQTFPAVAKGMNSIRKVVFSRTLDEVSWSNTTLVKGDLVTEVRNMKEQSGRDTTILGSGSVVSQLAQAGLIDEYQFVVNPVVLGVGRTLFEGVTAKLNLKLISSRAFSIGNVVLHYAPVK